MTTEPMLEACPNCGSAAEQPFIGDAVQCTNKNCLTFSPNPAAWNTRVSRTPPVDQDEVERMRARIVELDAECERAWESYRIAHDQAMANGEALANARHLLNGDASIGSGAGDVREALMEAGKAFKRLAKGDVGQPENLAFNAWQMIEGVLGEPVQ